MLQPFMPQTSENMLRQLGMKEQDWDSIYEYKNIPNGTKVIEKGEPLFMRLNMEEEVEYIKNGMAGNCQ